MIKISENCLICGLCLDNCPEKALVFKDASIRLNGRCSACGGCVEICPAGAIVLVADSQELYPGR